MDINNYIFKRYKKIVSLDSIRLLKFLEMFQQSVILVILSIIVAYIWNRSVRFFKLDINKNDKNISNIVFLEDIVKLIIQTFIIILITFYIRKIGLLIPSISSIINPKFKSNTTLPYILPIAIIAIIFNLVPSLTNLLDRIAKYQYAPTNV